MPQDGRNKGMMSESSRSKRTSPTATRPGVIWSVAGAGGLFTAAPFGLTHWASSDYGKWEVIAATTLTNVGTTLMLAAVLFYLERHFTKEVSAAVVESTRSEVVAQTKDIRQATHELQQRVSSISQELDERRRARMSDMNSTVERVRRGISFDSVAELLERANDLNALWFGSLVVPAGTRFDSPRVEIFWGDDHSGQFNIGNVFDDSVPSIVLSYEVPASRQEGGYTPARSFWRYQQLPVEALDDLVANMQAAGYATAANLLTAELFDHLADAVEQAIAARTASSNAWMQGRLAEWISEGWAITDRGLESREGIRISADQFPDRGLVARARREDSDTQFAPAPPADVNADLWALAVERSLPRFPAYRRPVATSDMGPTAYNTQTSPRRRDDWPPQS